MLAIAKDIVGALERKIQYGKGIIAHISKWITDSTKYEYILPEGVVAEHVLQIEI